MYSERAKYIRPSPPNGPKKQPNPPKDMGDRGFSKMGSLLSSKGQSKAFAMQSLIVKRSPLDGINTSDDGGYIDFKENPLMVLWRPFS